MGWVESVPYFCAVTETVTDITNHFPINVMLVPHPLENLAHTLPPTAAAPTAMTAPSYAYNACSPYNCNCGASTY